MINTATSQPFLPSTVYEHPSYATPRERMHDAVAATDASEPPVEEAYDPMKIMLPLFIEFLFYGDEEQTGNPPMETAL